MRRKRDGRDTTIFNLRLKIATVDQLRIAAEEERRTMTDFTRLLVEDALRARKERR